MDELGKTIVQLIPPVNPMYNIYGNNGEKSYYHERVCCLALCADGVVRSLSGGDIFDFADRAGNYVACVNQEELIYFPVSN